MGTNEEMDIEIDIISLIYRVLKHWRLLIVSMIIGGILMNGFGYWRSKKAAFSVQQTINNYQEKLASGTYDEKGNTLMSIPDFEKNLTERQINEVNNLVSTYKMYQSPYSNTVEYINNSLLMQIDPKAVPTYNIQYTVDTHYSVEYPLIEKKDYSQDILNSISNLLITNDTLTSIATELSSDEETIETNYIPELITSTITEDTFTITIHGRTKEECEIIAGIIKDKMPGVFKKLKSQYDDFDYNLTSESYFETYDKTIQTSQRAQADELNNIYKTTQGMIQNLTDEQKSYFYALLNNEDTVSVELPVDANSSEEEIDPSTLEVPAIQKFSIKYTVLGFFAGLLITSAMIVCITLLRGRLFSSKDIEDRFGISQLGVWKITPAPKGILSIFDKLLIKLFERNDGNSDPEEALKRITTDIKLSANKNEWSSVYLATTSRDSSTIDAISLIADKLQGTIKNIKYGNTIYYDSHALENFTSSDAIVIIEQTDISKMNEIKREYNICKRYNLPIIGYVTLK